MKFLHRVTEQIQKVNNTFEIFHIKYLEKKSKW